MDLQHIFVNCDVIGSHLVDSMLARSLRSVYYPTVNGHNVIYRVYYVLVEKTDFQMVAVLVLTKLGNRAPFSDSVMPVVALLHFCRI